MSARNRRNLRPRRTLRPPTRFEEEYDDHIVAAGRTAPRIRRGPITQAELDELMDESDQERRQIAADYRIGRDQRAQQRREKEERSERQKTKEARKRQRAQRETILARGLTDLRHPAFLAPTPQRASARVPREADKEEDIYERAFRTKRIRQPNKIKYRQRSTDIQALPTITGSKKPKRELRQWFPPGTWMVDLVKFGDDWWVFFVEGNSRYLITIKGTDRGDESVADTRVKGRRFKDIWQLFRTTARSTKYTSTKGKQKPANASPIRFLIGDSEKAFWTATMKETFDRQGVQTEAINTAQYGHNGLAILNRVVRTIRDMNYNMGREDDEVDDTQMRRLTNVYNHTRHSTLSSIFHEGICPNDIHYNPRLELQVIRAAKIDNYLRRKQPGFHLRPGQRVQVERIRQGGLTKHRSKYLPGVWTITRKQANLYEVRNNQGRTTVRSRAMLRKI